MTPDELKLRTRKFALRVIRLTESLPPGRVSHVLAMQLLRSATSVSANYRAACRARSKRDFIHKLTIVEEEADESHHWMELLIEARLVPPHRLQPLIQEAHELTAIVVAAIRTARKTPRGS